MKQVFPNYYEKFKCIADKCKHSCCVGWEIDIDEDTMDLYNSLDGEWGKKIRSNICGEPPHFVLAEDERCPFLNQNGLCDIVCEFGEEGLCDICYLHPRFNNDYNGFTETGLGLCCEEAVRIILTNQEKFYIPLPDTKENAQFFKKRQEVFDILQDRTIGVLERFEKLAAKHNVKFEFSNKVLYDLYSALVRLDKNWDIKLERLKNEENESVFEREDLQIFFEQLACYFVFRHYKNGAYFTLLSCWVIGQLCASAESLDEMLDIARMYSSEIEYCEENTQTVIDFLV